MKPDKVNIMGIEYSITYVDKPSEVDLYHRDSLWGQIDLWTCTIRIYDSNTPIEAIWQSLIHEILHGIGAHLKLDILDDGRGNDNDKHDELDVLALALVDVFFRNGWIKE